MNMYNFKIKFTKKKADRKCSDNEIYKLIDAYYNALANNGQVISGYELFTDGYDAIYLTTVLPREDSLSKGNNNDYVDSCLNKLQGVFEMETIKEGDNFEYCPSCTCESPSCYFFDACNDGESPIVCGDCHRPVPLYEIPYIFGEKEHATILWWQQANIAMDTLWCYGLWDRFTYSQKTLPNSKLNRAGRKIVKELERVLGVPVYFYMNYFDEPHDGEIVPKGLPNEIPRSCPQCGGEWIEDSEFYKCEKCKLITDKRQRDE